MLDFLKEILCLIIEGAFKAVTMLSSYFLLLVSITIVWRYTVSLWQRSKRRPISSSNAVLITGATSGIGLALAKFLHRQGYSVIVGYYDDNEAGFTELQKMKKTASSFGLKQRIGLVKMDVRDEESVAQAYDTCLKYLDEHKLQLISVVNNAGLGSLQPFSWIQRKTIVNLVNANLLGSLLVTREFLPLLIKSRGRIINVSSGLGVVPGPTYVTYGITKSAQIYFTLALNQELEQLHGVKSVVVIPHNFIKNTNITATNTRTCENSWAELKPLEKDLYKEDFDGHCKLSRQLEEASREHMKLVAEHEIKKAACKDAHQVSESGSSRLIRLTRPLIDFFDRLTGKNASLSVEDSLEFFYDAISLENPSEYIFAGDITYSLIVGSILLCLPASCLKLLGKSVASSMYK